MRKPVVSLLVGVFVAVVSLLAPGRSPVTVTAQPAVDLTGNWGYVYSYGHTTFGECTVGLLQTGGVLSSTTDMQCTSAVGGKLTGTVSGLDVDLQIAFTSPGLTVAAEGTASADGNTQEGNWGLYSHVDPNNTYIGSRLIDTPPGSSVLVSADSGGRTIGVTFDTVTDDGGTAIISDSSTAGTLPGQFQVLGLFFHVITTATYSPPISVCATYDDADNDGYEDTTHRDEKTLQILHDVGGSFVPVPDNGKTDYDENTLCGNVDSLSNFALVVPSTSPVGGIAELPDIANTRLGAQGSSGRDAGFPAALTAAVAAGVAALAGGAWYARRRWLR